MASADRCVFCGAIIPEGSHVCPNCKAAVCRDENGDAYAFLVKYMKETAPKKEKEVQKDLVELVHGRWEKVKQDLGDGIKTYRFGCSECGYLKNTLTGNYCPNCGAKMDGERKANERKDSKLR